MGTNVKPLQASLPPPDQPIRCLLISPRFPLRSFWNFAETCETIGAKAPNIPLGLVTVAAIFPQHWQFRLVDINCRDITEEDWDWADLIAVTAMLPQQQSALDMIRTAKARRKFVIIGGPDASNQSEVYAEADARILGEGEVIIPQWLQSWRQGEPRGTFSTDDKADMTQSPIPRYDLVNFLDYAQAAVQISRGCPFNCEFCDIIVLYGRKPRAKAPEQVIAELETIKALGYRGAVDVVDDNFIGNKRYVKRELLPALRKWNRPKLRPFYFGTEASMNLADDPALMHEMLMAGFRIVFLGIETPRDDLLMATQKSQNTMKPITERIRKIHRAGLMVTGGFIMGFDNEPKHMDRDMIECIERAPVAAAMVGLLVALPQTQLYFRLQREGRLLGFDGNYLNSASVKPANTEGMSFDASDQTTAGLNFIPTRSRQEIIKEYQAVIDYIYSPGVYLERLRRQIIELKARPKRIPRWFEIRRDLPGLLKIVTYYLKDKETRWPFIKLVATALTQGVNNFDMALRFSALYVHWRSQRHHVLKTTQEMHDTVLPYETELLKSTATD